MLRRFPIGYRPDRGVLSAEKEMPSQVFARLTNAPKRGLWFGSLTNDLSGLMVSE